MAENQAKNSLVETFSGIRGIYGQDINEELAYKYALAYCSLLKGKNFVLVIGGDTRASTLAIKQAMINAFHNFGIGKIIDVGTTPIQVCEYAILKFKASGGVYITASHNEPEYNGWKFLKEDGAILYKEQANRLIKKAHSVKLPVQKEKNSKINVLNKSKEAVDAYIKLVADEIGKNGIKEIKEANFKILVDPNGGASIAVLAKLFERFRVQAKIINNEAGKFSRLIEPNVKSLAYLSDLMNKAKFEFGCGFDCDSDRVEFILSDQMVSGQYVLALACDAYLAGTKNQTVIVNDCTSYLIRDVIKKYGAKIKEVEVGETNVVKEMEKQKSIIGGEGSNGGVILPPIKCRDGIMATILILKLIAHRKKSLRDIIADYPKYYSERIAKKCQPEKVIAIKKNIEKYYKEKGYKIKKTGGESGGLKAIVDDDSYIWFRESKTELGVFRIISDGSDQTAVKNSLLEAEKIFDKFSN